MIRRRHQHTHNTAGERPRGATAVYSSLLTRNVQARACVGAEMPESSRPRQFRHSGKKASSLGRMTSCTPFRRASNSAPPHCAIVVFLAHSVRGHLCRTSLAGHLAAVHHRASTSTLLLASRIAALFPPSPHFTAPRLASFVSHTRQLHSGAACVGQCLPRPHLGSASPSPSSSLSSSPPPPSHPPRPPVTGLPAPNIDCQSRPAWCHATRMATLHVVN